MELADVKAAVAVPRKLLIAPLLLFKMATSPLPSRRSRRRQPVVVRPASVLTAG
jgi:hypothetical protein